MRTIRSDVETEALPDGQVLLTTVAVISYFLFLCLFIYTAVTLDSACLYTFWLPYENQLFSPYWLTVAMASGLFIWGLFGLAMSGRRGLEAKWMIVYYAMATILLSWWLYDLWGFWNAMQYERGLLNFEQYYGELANPVLGEPHQCTRF